MLRHYLFVGVPIQKREHVSDPHLFLAWKLADMAEKFIYAHEIAHILLGHDTKAAQHDLPVAFEDSSEISPSVQEEIDADLLGWVLLVKVIIPEEGGISEGDLQLAYAGTRLFLRIAQLLEYAGNITVTGTHPPTADRLDYMCIAGQSTAEEFNAPFEMLKVIDNAMQDAMAKLEQALPPLPWQSPVAEIIKEAVVATSQHGFFSLHGTNTRLSAVREFLWLLSYGASGKLCRELGRTMGKAMLELEAPGIDLTIEETSDAPPYRPEVIKASLPTFTAFWLISALESAYLPREISRFIEHHRQCYLDEQKHAA